MSFGNTSRSADRSVTLKIVEQNAPGIDLSSNNGGELELFFKNDKLVGLNVENYTINGEGGRFVIPNSFFDNPLDRNDLFMLDDRSNNSIFMDDLSFDTILNANKNDILQSNFGVITSTSTGDFVLFFEVSTKFEILNILSRGEIDNKNINFTINSATALELEISKPEQFTGLGAVNLTSSGTETFGTNFENSEDKLDVIGAISNGEKGSVKSEIVDNNTPSDEEKTKLEDNLFDGNSGIIFEPEISGEKIDISNLNNKDKTNTVIGANILKIF